MNSADWVPSHVQITIHRARELLLKNKNTQSELYVNIHTYKDKFVSSTVPRSTAPEWTFTTEIPLMSLDTTVHFTVRQKGRLTDDFLGCTAIPLGSFSLNSKQVTHWYKLGSKPGKPNLKLRGELLVSVKLLYNWIQSADSYMPESGVSKKVFPPTGQAMMKHSKSDMKMKPPDSLCLIDTEKPSQNSSKTKGKKSAFRMSFKKKSKSPMFEECDEDFTTFSPPTQFTRARSHTIDTSFVTTHSSQTNSLCDIKDVSSESEVVSSDKGLSQSPSFRPSVQALFAEAASLENEENLENSHKEQSVDTEPHSLSAARFYSFRSRKKRWTMHTLPINIPPPTHSLSHSPSADCANIQTNADSTLSANDSPEDGTYIAKSNTLTNNLIVSRIRTKSHYEDDSQPPITLISEKETTPESSGGIVTSGCCPQAGEQDPSESCDTESGYNTSSSVYNRIDQSSVVGKDSSNGTSTDLSKKGKTRTENKTAVTKRTPSQRKLTDSPSTKRTVTTPKSPQTKRMLSQKGNRSSSASNSPTPRRTKPRILSNGGSNTRQTEVKSRSISSSRTSSTASTPSRTPTVSRTPSTGKPLSSDRSSKVSQMRVKSSSLQRRRNSMFEISSKPLEVQEPPTTERVLKDKHVTAELTVPDVQVGSPVSSFVPQIDDALSVTPEMNENKGFKNEQLLDGPRESANTMAPEVSGLSSSKTLSAEVSSNSESIVSSLTSEPSLTDKNSSTVNSESQTISSPTDKPTSINSESHTISSPTASINSESHTISSPTDKPTSINSESHTISSPTSEPCFPVESEHCSLVISKPHTILSPTTKCSLPDHPTSINSEPCSPDELSSTPKDSTSNSAYSPEQPLDSESLVESTSVQQTSPSAPAAKKPRHTVAYAQSSLFKDGFQPASLLPPSLMEYRAQTLPTRGKLARYASENTLSLSSTSTRPSTISYSNQELLAPNQSSTHLRPLANRSPENTRFVNRRSLNFSLHSSFNESRLSTVPQSPPSCSSAFSLDHTDQPNQDTRSTSQLSASTMVSGESDSRPATPQTPSSVKYGGQTAGEIVTSALRTRKPTGGLRKAINMYQENRKQKREDRLTPMSGPNREEVQKETECLDRASGSVENSPQLHRNLSAASSLSNILQNPFSSLRRSKSHTISPSPTPKSVPRSAPTSAPNIKNTIANSMRSNDTVSGKSAQQSSSHLTTDEEATDSLSSAQNEGTVGLTDSSSVKTLTDVESSRLSSHMPTQRTPSPNPAGAGAGSHTRNTTCSSIGSEGFGSLMSEELSLEELGQRDWAQLSKEELIKELIYSKVSVDKTEQELRDVKNYLDKLLLKIMESNPSLLNSIYD